MWVRAQIDYLQRLPNDTEKRNALKRLPPDLHQTYSRILETIDSSYPVQTTKYIQRLLKWLVLAGDCDGQSVRTFHSSRVQLSIDAVREAICVEDEGEWPASQIVPTTDQVMRWLGCLGRLTKDSNRLELSHFTVKEFLQKNTTIIGSPEIQKFLVVPEDTYYLLEICLICVLHERFRQYYPQVLSLVSASGPKAETSSYAVLVKSFCHYVTANLTFHVRLLGDTTNYDGELIRRFLSSASDQEFKMWAACHKMHDARHETVQIPSNIYFASLTGLASQVWRLLQQGASTDPHGTEIIRHLGVTPLHIAIVDRSEALESQSGNFLCLWKDVARFEVSRSAQDCSRKMVKSLVEFGADLNQQALIYLHEDLVSCSKRYHMAVTPLTLAIMYHDWEMASFLLDAGADQDATKDHSPNTSAHFRAHIKASGQTSLKETIERPRPQSGRANPEKQNEILSERFQAQISLGENAARDLAPEKTLKALGSDVGIPTSDGKIPPERQSKYTRRIELNDYTNTNSATTAAFTLHTKK
ncbi:MAG: hypothetical protein Q9168_002059 [Polycauliona sp. 1 TL-2023]